MKEAKSKFQYKESYKHRYAKKLLIHWLRKIDEKEDFCEFGSISWRSNWGVHEELPFYETSDPYYFELSKGLIFDVPWKPYNHKEVFQPGYNRGKLLFIPDITIFHKGAAVHFIEVVHKSWPSNEKIEKISKYVQHHHCYCSLWMVTCDYILNQTHQPEDLFFDRIEFT